MMHGTVTWCLTSYSAADQLTSRTGSGGSATYTYDLNGSLISDGSRAYEWDGANRLTSFHPPMAEA
jgi:YD repeat-containing protein